MITPRVLVLRAPGTNCDEETAFAWELAGGAPERVHLNQLIHGERHLEEFQILTIPGGFSFADSVGAGKLLANELSYRLQDSLHQFVERDGLILGICNGFQALCKAGLLSRATLFFNDSGHFECRWVTLERVNRSTCLWTRSIERPIELPVAHGEGKFVPANEEALEQFWANDQVVFQYAAPGGRRLDEAGFGPQYPHNPNGSVDHIAGVCNEKGTVFGLMPHPERHVLPWQHPRFRREERDERHEGDGLAIFRSAISALT
jgi:phosphoribosylformylglycinamidine synthase I